MPNSKASHERFLKSQVIDAIVFSTWLKSQRREGDAEASFQLSDRSKQGTPAGGGSGRGGGGFGSTRVVAGTTYCRCLTTVITGPGRVRTSHFPTKLLGSGRDHILSVLTTVITGPGRVRTSHFPTIVSSSLLHPRLRTLSPKYTFSFTQRLLTPSVGPV